MSCIQIVLLLAAFSQSSTKTDKGIFGTLDSIDQKTQTFTIKSGKDIEMFKADADTRISRDGRTIDFGDMKNGERASVSFDKKTDLARWIKITTVKSTSPTDRKQKRDEEAEEAAKPPEKKPESEMPRGRKEAPRKEEARKEEPPKEEPKKTDPPRKSDMRLRPAGSGVRSGTGSIGEDDAVREQKDFDAKVEGNQDGKVTITRTIRDNGQFEFTFTIVCEWDANRKTDPSVHFRFALSTNQAKPMFGGVTAMTLVIDNTDRIKDIVIAHEKPTDGKSNTETLIGQTNLGILKKLADAKRADIRLGESQLPELTQQEILRVKELFLQIEKMRSQVARPK